MMLVLIGVLFLSFSSVYAETVLLKSGKSVEGKLIEKTDKYIKIDFQGVPLNYFLDEIESIDGVKPSLSSAKEIKSSQGDNLAPVSNKTAEEYFNEGAAFDKQGNLLQAISDFTKAIAINPNYAEAYNDRGDAYIHQGNFPQAIVDFTKVIEISSKYSVVAYQNRGFAYASQGNFLQAISDCTKAIEINPNFAEAYCIRGISYYWTKEYDKAWIDVHKAEGLGYAVNPKFINALKKASGRDK